MPVRQKGIVKGGATRTGLEHLGRLLKHTLPMSVAVRRTTFYGTRNFLQPDERRRDFMCDMICCMAPRNAGSQI